MMSIWLRDQLQPRRRRALTRAVIASRAVELLDETGLRGLTLRLLATRLEVAQSSLYGHVTTKDDVLDLALDDALGRDLPGLDAGRPPPADIRDLLLRWREHLLRHPWAPLVVARRTPLGPHYLQLADQLCAGLAERGVPAEQILTTSYALSNYILGAVIAQNAATTTDADIARRSRARGLMRPYPALSAAFEAPTPGWDDSVEHGLDLILNRGTASA